jgi:hypothetical protein
MNNTNIENIIVDNIDEVAEILNKTRGRPKGSKVDKSKITTKLGRPLKNPEDKKMPKKKEYVMKPNQNYKGQHLKHTNKYHVEYNCSTFEFKTIEEIARQFNLSSLHTNTLLKAFQKKDNNIELNSYEKKILDNNKTFSAFYKIKNHQQ